MIGTELLDDPQADPALVGSELRDIARLNRLFGGTRAVVEALEPYLRQGGSGQRATSNVHWTLLDVGTGLGDIPRAAAAAARRRGITLRLVGIELNRTAARLARAPEQNDALAVILADGGSPPLGPRSVDVVVASQVLHHLPRPAAVHWIAACDRMARRAVVLADLRRSRVAMGGVWAASFGLGMSSVTRHDAVVSVRRGYTRREFDALLLAAGVPARARYRPGFRIVAAWEPAHAGG
ncbi:MAG TPA: methyltransferase domain-containing protein [Gemmatimonadales bacterium]|jgi:2-polyprenyl-3-methyl-5-hydroxy-6-metoxy-1,4-benzoquinol methylase|nr:methyltransferase domain-containing protein [Gemmatimonadales bacterium]